MGRRAGTSGSFVVELDVVHGMVRHVLRAVLEQPANMPRKPRWTACGASVIFANHPICACQEQAGPSIGGWRDAALSANGTPRHKSAMFSAYEPMLDAAF